MAGHLTFPLLSVTLLVSFGSSMLYGYNLAVVNSPAVHIKAFYNATWSRRYGHGLAPGLLTLLYSVTVSVFALGGLVGSLLVGMLVERYGRNGALSRSALLVLLAGGFMGFSRELGSPEMVIVGRSITGLHSGICLSVVPLYLGEIAPKSLRGFLGLMPSIFICLGVFFAQVLGLPELLGEDRFWPLLLSVVVVPASLQLLLLHCFPESPRYLLIERNDVCGATEALRRFLGTHDVQDVIEEMKEEQRSLSSVEMVSVWQLLRDRCVRWQTLSVVVLNAGMQLSGIDAIWFYTNTIFEKAGIPVSQIPYTTVGTGVIEVVTGLIGPPALPSVRLDCSGAAPQTAPDGRAEIGYKITGICCAVNALPAAAVAALPALPPVLRAPRAQPGTPTRGTCGRGTNQPQLCANEALRDPAAALQSPGAPALPMPHRQPWSSQLSARSSEATWSIPPPAAGSGVQEVPLSQRGAPRHPVGVCSPLAVLHHREAGPAAAPHRRLLHHGRLLGWHHRLAAAADRSALDALRQRRLRGWHHRRLLRRTSWCPVPGDGRALHAVSPPGCLHRGGVPQLALQLHCRLHLPLLADVSWCLLLPGFLWCLPAGGPVCLHHHPRDQEQNLHGDQPHLWFPSLLLLHLRPSHWNDEAWWLWGLGEQLSGGLGLQPTLIWVSWAEKGWQRRFRAGEGKFPWAQSALGLLGHRITESFILAKTFEIASNDKPNAAKP